MKEMLRSMYGGLFKYNSEMRLSSVRSLGRDFAKLRHSSASIFITGQSWRTCMPDE